MGKWITMMRQNKAGPQNLYKTIKKVYFRRIKDMNVKGKFMKKIQKKYKRTKNCKGNVQQYDFHIGVEERLLEQDPKNTYANIKKN